MNRLSRLTPACIVLLLALPLAGCFDIPITQDVLDTTRQAYNSAFLTPAANYRSLPACAAGQKFTALLPCHDPAIVKRLVTADTIVDNDFTTLQYDLTQSNANSVSALQALTLAIANAEAIIPLTKP